MIGGNLGSDGAGIDMHQDTYPIIQRCLITGNGNFNTFSGGGIRVCNVSARIESCTISGNWALVGAGIEIKDLTPTPIAPTIVNCTITGNYGQASNHGGAGIHLFDMEVTPTVTNTVLWGNYARGGSGNSHEIELEGTSTIIVSYSDVSGGWPGAGNINVIPEFIDPRPAMGLWLRRGLGRVRRRQPRDLRRRLRVGQHQRLVGDGAVAAPQGAKSNAKTVRK